MAKKSLTQVFSQKAPLTHPVHLKPHFKPSTIPTAHQSNTHRSRDKIVDRPSDHRAHSRIHSAPKRNDLAKHITETNNKPNDEEMRSCGGITIVNRRSIGKIRNRQQSSRCKTKNSEESRAFAEVRTTTTTTEQPSNSSDYNKMICVKNLII